MYLAGLIPVSLHDANAKLMSLCVITRCPGCKPNSTSSDKQNSNYCTCSPINPPYLIHGSCFRIPVAVDNQAIVSLVDEVCAARDVIHGGGLPLPVPQLPGVGHKPDMHIMVLCKAFDLGQHLADILCL